MQKWPPLIIKADRSMAVVWRDRLMTIGLWAILVWLFVKQSSILAGRLSELMYPSDPNQVIVWEFRLLPFLTVALILVLRLCLWAVVSKRSYERVTRDQSPPALDMTVEAARAGLSAAEIKAARQLPVAVVHLGTEGHYRLEAPALPPKT